VGTKRAEFLGASKNRESGKMQTIPNAVAEDFNARPDVYGPPDVGFFIGSEYVSADWSWSITYGTATPNDVQLQSTFAPNMTHTATGPGIIDVGQLIIGGDTPGQTDAEEGSLTFNLVFNIVEHKADGTAQDISFTDAYTILDNDFATFPFTGDAMSQIEAIYIGYYGRAGDPDGTNYWTNQLLNGGSTVQSMTGIAASYSVQPESQAQYPFLANPLGATTSGAGNDLDQFINSVYQNLFGRAADGTDTSGGLGYWRGQILNVLATHDSTALANELGSFILQVAYGAQGQDQTVLANKVSVADAITQTFSAHNIQFGTTADQFAHADIASVTASAASVTAADIAIIGIINSLI
jgi:hypothetical protein